MGVLISGMQQAWGKYLSLDDLQTNIIDGVTTTMTVGEGQGARYASASTARPHRLVIDDEVIYATGRSGDTITIVRAREGTTGAAHTAGTGVIKHMIPIQITNANGFTLDPNIQTITFEGDGAAIDIFQSQKVTGQITHTEWSPDILEFLAGCTKQTTNLPNDEAFRFNPELGSYSAFELDVYLGGVDRSNQSADITLRLRIFRTKIQKPYTLGEIGNLAALQLPLQWTSEKTTTDLTGRTIPGVTTNGITHAIAQLA